MEEQEQKTSEQVQVEKTEAHSAGCGCVVCEDRSKEPKAPTPMEDVYRYMDSSSISMAILPKSVVHDIGSRNAFIGRPDMEEVQERMAKVEKEPKIEGAQVATFNLEYLLQFLKVVEKNISDYVTLEVKTGEPIKCVARGDRGEARFYLAPYMEE